MQMYFIFPYLFFSRMNSENEEAAFLKDRRFIVEEREILQIIKKSISEHCSELIDEHTIQEGEKIAAGI